MGKKLYFMGGSLMRFWNMLQLLSDRNSPRIYSYPLLSLRCCGLALLAHSAALFFLYLFFGFLADLRRSWFPFSVIMHIWILGFRVLTEKLARGWDKLIRPLVRFCLIVWLFSWIILTWGVCSGNFLPNELMFRIVAPGRIIFLIRI